jgi:hypothetical protein
MCPGRSLVGCDPGLTDYEEEEAQVDEFALSATTKNEINCTGIGVVGPTNNGYRFQSVSLLLGKCSRSNGSAVPQIGRVSFSFPNNRTTDALAFARGANAAIAGAHRVTFTLQNKVTGAYRETRPFARALEITRDGQVPVETQSEAMLFSAQGSLLAPIR